MCIKFHKDCVSFYSNTFILISNLLTCLAIRSNHHQISAELLISKLCVTAKGLLYYIHANWSLTLAFYEHTFFVSILKIHHNLSSPPLVRVRRECNLFLFYTNISNSNNSFLNICAWASGHACLQFPEVCFYEA